MAITQGASFAPKEMTAHAPPQHDLAARIQPDEAAAVLAQIDPEYRDYHCSAPFLISAARHA